MVPIISVDKIDGKGVEAKIDAPFMRIGPVLGLLEYRKTKPLSSVFKSLEATGN